MKHCALYNKTVDVSTCKIIGGLPSENPDEICENAQGCDVSTLTLTVSAWVDLILRAPQKMITPPKF